MSMLSQIKQVLFNKSGESIRGGVQGIGEKFVRIGCLIPVVGGGNRCHSSNIS